MLVSIALVSDIGALPKALQPQPRSDTNMFLEQCTSLLLTTSMMQVHMREKSISKPFMVVKCSKRSQIIHLLRRGDSK